MAEACAGAAAPATGTTVNATAAAATTPLRSFLPGQAGARDDGRDGVPGAARSRLQTHCAHVAADALNLETAFSAFTSGL